MHQSSKGQLPHGQQMGRMQPRTLPHLLHKLLRRRGHGLGQLRNSVHLIQPRRRLLLCARLLQEGRVRRHFLLLQHAAIATGAISCCRLTHVWACCDRGTLTPACPVLSSTIIVEQVS